MKALRSLMDQLKSKLDAAVMILYSIEGDKISVLAGVSKNIISKVPSAVAFAKQLSDKAGGRDDMAQGGGPVPPDLESRLAQIKPMIEHQS